jgi:hypothetical protein
MRFTGTEGWDASHSDWRETGKASSYPACKTRAEPVNAGGYLIVRSVRDRK